MYRTYFGIDENPFSITPDPRYLYMSEKHQEALAHLLYGVKEGGGFVLLTGEVGTGKTTISRCLLEELPANVDAALCINPRMNEVELLGNICDELGIAYPRGASSPKILVDALNRHLLSAHAAGRRSVLVIDEAQNLSPDVLEQIRLLTNLETRKHKLLQIILIGQPELNDLLARHELRQLAQRITARYHLNSLTQRETAGLVRHRLTTGGLDSALFDNGALAEVYRFSGGTPRLINSICDRCLLAAFARNRRRIDRRLVRIAAKEVLGEARPKRHGRRVLPWAAATTAAAAAALFVAYGPIDTSLNWLLARYDAVFAPTETVTAAPPAEAVAGLPAAPTQPAASIAEDAPETKPDDGAAGAAIGADQRSTEEGRDSAASPVVEEAELGAPPATAPADVVASEPAPTPPPTDIANAPTMPTEAGQVAAASPVTEETEPSEPPADADTPVVASEPAPTPPPTVTDEAEPREPPAEVVALVAADELADELAATPSTADLAMAQPPRTDEGLAAAASPVADEVETSEPPAEAEPVMAESMPTPSTTDVAMAQPPRTDEGLAVAASPVADEVETSEPPAEAEPVMAESMAPPMTEQSEPTEPPAEVAGLVAEREPAPTPPPTDIADLPPKLAEEEQAAAPVADEPEPPEPPATAETPVAENEPAPIDVATAQPPGTVATFAPQTPAATPVEAAVAPLQSELPDDEPAVSTAVPEIDLAGIGSEATAAPPASQPDAPETLETLFGRPGIEGDLETALATLFERWRLDYLGLKGFAPCSKAASVALKCLQMESDWAGLRSLNRPALITLAFADGRRLHAVVSSIDDDSVTLLVGAREIVAERDTITPHWSGQFLALWNAPEVYRRHMRTGMSGPDVDWLGKRLAALDGGTSPTGEPAAFDQAMRQRVMAFQRERGLEVDAVVGPRTMIQLNIAVGAPAEPVLRQPVP